MKRKTRNLILLCISAIAIGSTILIYLNGGLFHRRYSDNGMYDDAQSIVAQTAHVSRSDWSFAKDPDVECGASVKFLGLGGRASLARISAKNSDSRVTITTTLECTSGRLKAVAYQIEDTSYATIAKNTATESTTLAIPAGDTYIALIGDKADGTCSFKIDSDGKDDISIELG